MLQRRESGRGKMAGSAKLSKLGRADLGQFFALPLALCASVPTMALAADLPAPVLPPIYKEPPVVYNWTGFYIGGNIGAAWQGLSGTNFSDTIGSTFTAPTNLQFMGGGQVGVNYQFWGSVVIGAEAMFDWLPGNQSSLVTATDPTGAVAANITNVNERWLATATGRLGYAWDRILLYAKGGGAWVATNSPAISVGGAPASFASISNANSFGYTAGFGLEWAFAGNWSLRVEYDYIGLPSQSFTVAAGTPTFGGDVITFNRNISIATGAINYKFGGW
jgi:outer membrane immunogenic protein